MRRLATGLAVLLALAGAARGDDADVDRFDWQRVAGAGKRAYRAAMNRADGLAARAAQQVNEGDDGRGKALSLRAVDAYEAASAADPTQPEPHYRAAEVLYEHFIDIRRMHQIMGDTRHPAERALRHWAEWFRLAPRDPRAAGVLFSRSLLHTKLGGEASYRAAIADYDAQLRLLDSGVTPPDQMATVLSNAAEIYMALGDIDAAIELYQSALDFNNEALYAYGLAVALDRDDQGGRARELMARYHYSQTVLDRQVVFFVPPGDENYYKALGNETLGDWESALKYYENFLRYQPKSPYAPRAKEHIARLSRWVKTHKKPVPKPAPHEVMWP
ncbi:MAG TPA: hypothetical protein VMZ28_12225 [Kofleriaceae bacterium]|nr:hypothetical protein [Kofleriaceae bacterium]